MKVKALGNLKAAQQLINQKKEDLCTASIHCSYYAVFQYMKYMLAHTERRPISYLQQASEEAGNSGSHEYMIGKIKERILNPNNARDFAQDIRKLKRERVDADYNTRIFNINESLECKEQAEGLITKLKTYFGNL